MKIKNNNGSTILVTMMMTLLITTIITALITFMFFGLTYRMKENNKKSELLVMTDKVFEYLNAHSQMVDKEEVIGDYKFITGSLQGDSYKMIITKLDDFNLEITITVKYDQKGIYTITQWGVKR